MFFSNKEATKKQNEEQGLVISVDELIAEQKYLPYLQFNSSITSQYSGNMKSAFKGRGMEFAEVRKYIYGDDVRDIDWRVTARKLEPYTKVFSEEKDRQISVLLDLSATMVFGTRKELKSVTACRLAALLGWMTLKNKDRFGILIYNGKDMEYFKPQSNPKNLLQIMNKISQMSRKILENSYMGDMSEALETLQYYQKGRGTIFILSDFYDFNASKSKNLAALAKHNYVCCINIFDILEEIPPLEGIYAAQYEQQKVIFNSDSKGFKEAYEQYFAENKLKLKASCQKLLCKYIEIRTDMPIFKQLSSI